MSPRKIAIRTSVSLPERRAASLLMEGAYPVRVQANLRDRPGLSKLEVRFGPRHIRRETEWPSCSSLSGKTGCRLTRLR